MYRSLIVVSLFFGSQCLADNTQNEFVKNMAKCGAKDGFEGLLNCASLRLLKNLDRLDQMENIQIAPGIFLTGQTNTNETSRLGKSLKALPTDSADKSSALFNMVLEAISKFFSSRTLKIKLPSSSPETLSRAFEEGRGKMKKLMGPLMGIGVKVLSSMAIVLAALATLTLKALSVGTLALIVSIILFIQYYFSGTRILSPYGGGYNTYGYGYGTGYGVPAGTGGTNQIGGGGWSPQFPYKRSFEVEGELKSDPQELAYSSTRTQ